MEMETDFSLETLVYRLSSEKAGFNLVHFRDVTHINTAKAHFWVSISLCDGEHILLSMVTTGMSRLERLYREDEDSGERALDSLVPLSNEDLSVISEGCVINCNETRCLSSQELIAIIDTEYHSPITGREFDRVHLDNEFSPELKEKIIQAIVNSPYVKPDVKEAVSNLVFS